MADIYGSHFEYNGVSSRKYGLIFVNVETDRFTNLVGETEGAFIYNKTSNKRHLIADDYSGSPFSFEVDIITDNGRGIELNLRREIEAWLFRSRGFKRMYIDPQDDCFSENTELINGTPKRFYLNCRFINPAKLEYNGGIVGYRVTLEADSGFWWQDEVTYQFVFTGAQSTDTRTVTVPVENALGDYIYPDVTVTLASGCTEFSLHNNTDSQTRLTHFTGLSAGSQITISGKTNYVSGTGNYEKFIDRNFPRLLDGENTIVTEGGVSFVSFTFNNRRAW